MRIGIAGYMGAGKSTCAHSFGGSGVLIIDADTEAKRLMVHERQLRNDLGNAFGDKVVSENDVHFDQLGLAAFKSTESLQTLNRIVHPPLIKHLKSLIYGSGKLLCVLDAALIPLWNIESWFDLRIWIDTPFDTRLNRLKLKRGDIDEREIVRRMKMQEEIMPAPCFKNWEVRGG